MNLLSDLSAVTVVFAILVVLIAMFAAMGLFARNYIKVPPSHGRHLLRAQAHASSTRRGTGPGSGSASCGAERRCGFPSSSRSPISP